MSSRIEALMRGLGQGASLGFNDDLSPGLVSAADKVTGWLGLGDQTGIPREYAAGSAYDDMRNTERRENQESSDKFPTTYRAGQIAGGMPASIAASGIGGGATLPTLSRLISNAPRIATAAPTLAAQVAGGGLAAGVRGGVEGAGLAEDGNRLNAAARAAAPSAALGMAGAAAPAAAKVVKDLFKGGPPGPLAPAMATVGSGAQPSAREIARGAQAARTAGTTAGGSLLKRTETPPLTPGGSSPAKTVPPPRRGASMVDKEAAGGRKLGPEETKTRHNAVPPPVGESSAVVIPKTQRLPRIERLDFDRTTSPLIDEAPAVQGATNAPKRLMGSEPPTVLYPQAGRPTVPSAALGQGPRVPFVEPNGPPTVPPDAVSPEARAALQVERAPFLPEDDVIMGHERPTTPPGALHYDDAVGPMRERARNAMLPPSTDEALDRSLISGLPEQRIPTEMTGRMPPSKVVFERLPGETDDKMAARIAVQDAEDRAYLHQAQGKEPGAHLKPMPERSGQSMFDADQLEGPKPKMPSEYQKPERPTGGYYSEFPEGHPQHGDGKTNPIKYGKEFELSSKRPTSGAKKTDVKKLMKKRPDDSDD